MHPYYDHLPRVIRDYLNEEGGEIIGDSQVNWIFQSIHRRGVEKTLIALKKAYRDFLARDKSFG